MKNPWGLEGKNPWKKNKKEPSLDKETDKDRIARLEKEVKELKNNQNKKYDDSWAGNDSPIAQGEKKARSKNKAGIITWIVVICAIIYVLGNLDLSTDKKKNKSSNSTPNLKDKTSYHKLIIGDHDKYAICYGQVTKVHKKTGLHENNHSGSIEAKEKICSAYSRGEISDYPRP